MTKRLRYRLVVLNGRATYELCPLRRVCAILSRGMGHALLKNDGRRICVGGRIAGLIVPYPLTHEPAVNKQRGQQRHRWYTAPSPSAKMSTTMDSCVLDVESAGTHRSSAAIIVSSFPYPPCFGKVVVCGVAGAWSVRIVFCVVGDAHRVGCQRGPLHGAYWIRKHQPRRIGEPTKRKRKRKR